MKVYSVYKKYNKDFIAYAKSITGNKDIAFDLVQDAYVRALENENIFLNMNEYQIKGWFFTVIKNRNIDFIRKENKVVLFDNDVPEEEIKSFEEEVVMKNLLESLPEKNKQILRLKFNMNLNSNEIGKVLGMSPSTVRSRLSASLKLLKKNL
ncbi:RNA polymerase sigma factor, sigma-70 family [Clostridium amylolyticum]|uniref:RNA polymerase sigma factor, sigma-70 family n=1 Tax=Clostridium amylolyticum TaxID=1121298 RepID=A0A1M6J9M9_9CLOT|nr:sigma-70 family RNA polymerase sigma factor [Clostridium amylolyticum]SHJ43361.1 RNA polymerase sigma factor, sigma-70 family [Clostridium amylolyticum]